MKVAYYMDCNIYCEWPVLLRPTGKWKIVNGPTDNEVIYVQHRFWLLFTTWISEKRIVFLPERESLHFNCGGLK